MKKEEIFLLSLKVELSSIEVFINIKLINFKASLTKNLPWAHLYTTTIHLCVLCLVGFHFRLFISTPPLS